MSVQVMESMVCWVDCHAHESPSLQGLSVFMGYSPYYCSVKFREFTGLTYKRYLSRHRVREAARLLRETDQKIIDIALCCGYSSPEALSHAFTGAYGCAPSGYRTTGSPRERREHGAE